MPAHSDHLKAYTSSLVHMHCLLSADLCTDPLLVLVAVTIVLDSLAANKHVVPADRQKASNAICYLAERLAMLTLLVDPSAPLVNGTFTPDVLQQG